MRTLHKILLLLAVAFFAIPEARSAVPAAWTAKCNGCHGTPPTGARVNAAGSTSVIDRAIANNGATGMGAITFAGTEKADIATYLENDVFNVTPLLTSTTYPTTKVIDISSDVIMNTSATGLNVLETIAAPPAGTLTYNVANRTITFDPTASQIGDVSFSYRARNTTTGTVTSTRSVTVTINKSNQTISFPSVADQVYSLGGTFTVIAMPSSNLAEVFSTPSSASICTVNSSTGVVTKHGVGTCTIRANQAGNSFYNAAPQVSQDILITKATQLVTFGAATVPPTPTFGNGTFSVTATSNAPGAVITFGVTTGNGTVCTVAPATGVVTILAAGSCNVTAVGAATSNYFASATANKLVIIAKASQTISFGAQSSPQAFVFGGQFPIFPLATGGGSGNPITYGTLTPSFCGYTSGTNMDFVAAGGCTIAANQAGNGNYNAATQVTQPVTITAVAPGAPTIGTGTAGDTTAIIGYTAPASNGGSPITKYRATCNPGGIFAEDTVAPFTAITVTGLTNSTLYTCSVTAFNVAGPGASSGTVNVTPSATPVAPTITSANATSFTVLSAGTFTVTATGIPTPTLSLSGSLPSGVTFTPGTNLLAGTPATGTAVPGSYPVTFSATNTQGTANQSFTLTVAKIGQTITFGAIPTTGFSPTPIPLVATASSTLPVSFTSGDLAVCTVSGATFSTVSVQTCAISAHQAGNADYAAAPQVTRKFDIVQGSQTITFDAQVPASRPFVLAGTFPVNPPATASSLLPVAYASATPTVCGVSGSTVSILSTGTCTIEASQPGDANYLSASTVTQDVVIGVGSQTINFPAQTRATQDYNPGGTFAIAPLATATSSLPVSYGSSTPGVCTVDTTTVTIVAVGTCTITANQSGNALYSAAPQVTRNVTIAPVVPGAPTIGTATAGNSQATIEFTPPTFDGGAPITGYIATCNPGNKTGNGTASPVKVLALANGTPYTCSVAAINSAGTGASSATTLVTPNGLDGATLWSNICSACHGPMPANNQVNGGGTTSTVIEYVRSIQPSMVLTATVQALAPADLVEIAKYIAQAHPAIAEKTKPNLAKSISVSSNLKVNTISFTSIEVLTPPAHGALTPFNGESTTYTPNPGYTGFDSFTYRGARTSPVSLLGDPRTVMIDVSDLALLLNVNRSGSGTGTVASFFSNGINCGSDCVEAYVPGAEVTLVATADPNSSFAGWGGACTGTGDCIVTMDAAKTVTATFNLPHVTRGDVNGDSKADLFWRLSAPGTGLSWWTMNGNALIGANYFDVGPEWQIADVGDLDGDGKADIIWRRTTDGAAYLWTLNGLGFAGFFDLGVLSPAVWTLIGSADFNGDGKSDILWRNADGTLYMWLMNAGTIVSQGVIGNPGSVWAVIDVADMNGDGKADIVFRNTTTGQVYIWFMDGLVTSAAGSPGGLDPSAWNLLAAADFDGDGKADLLWRSTAGDTWVWIMNGASFVSGASIGNPGLAWTIRSVADLDGDGKADLVWRHTDGTTYFWKMNGTIPVAFLPIANPGGSWQIVAP